MNTIDMSCETTCPEQIRFYHDSPKRTGTGLPFLSFAGLRMYLITDKKDGRYLTGSSAYMEQNVKPTYVYVEDLHAQLADALKLHLAKFPMLKLKLTKHTEIVWTKYGITPAEQEWVAIVRKVLSEQ